MPDHRTPTKTVATSTLATAGAVLYAKNVERVAPFYIECCGLGITHSEDDHVVLESPSFQLVILAIPESLAGSIFVATPPVRRENTPIKLVFHVESIDAIRRVIASLGGEINPPEREWNYQGRRVCDGHDPEGNVVQFRELNPSI
jgi:predicted enzyme related to lactoylglutathione lyase